MGEVINDVVICGRNLFCIEDFYLCDFGVVFFELRGCVVLVCCFGGNVVRFGVDSGKK